MSLRAKAAVEQTHPYSEAASRCMRPTSALHARETVEHALEVISPNVFIDKLSKFIFPKNRQLIVYYS